MSETALRLQRFYEGLAERREAGLDDLEQYFTSDIHFRDPFRETQGMEDFRELFVRMFRQYRTVRFDTFETRGDESNFVLTYDMHLRMAIGPTFVTRMASVCQARDGRVYDLLDFYDFSSALASPLPFLANTYRRVINALFL